MCLDLCGLVLVSNVFLNFFWVGGVLAYWMSTLHLKLTAASLLPSVGLRLFQ